MKRNCLKVAALLTLLCSVGCCYRPGGINPYNGIAYGGRWEPMPGGPLDARACCYGYGVGYCPTVPMAGCYDVCEPPCAMPAAGPYMMNSPGDCCDSPADSYPQTYVPSPHVMPDGSESVPGGMQPVPDPNMNPNPSKSGGATTYVVPQRLPVYQHSSYNQAASAPWVHAH
jgi:hypothetical protein